MQTSYTIERLKSIVRLGSIHFIATSFLLPFFSQQNTMTWIYPPSNNGKWRLFRLRFPILKNITSSWWCRLLHPGAASQKMTSSPFRNLFPASPPLSWGMLGWKVLLHFWLLWPQEASCIPRSAFLPDANGWLSVMLQIQFCGYIWIHDPCGFAMSRVVIHIMLWIAYNSI